MNTKKSHPDSFDSHLVVVSQIVRDVKVGGGNRRAQLASEIGRLRTGLQKKAYIPGDKLNASTLIKGIADDNVLRAEIYGGMLENSDLDMRVVHPFPLDWKSPVEEVRRDLEGFKLEEILVRHCNDVKVDDGGNSQNMAINLALAGLSAPLRDKLRLTIVSSSDPFKRLPGHVADRMQEAIDMGQYRVELMPQIQDRIAIQMPWRDGPENGTFALTTSPTRTGPVLAEMLREREDIRNVFSDGTGFIASDPILDEVKHWGDPRRRYHHLNNASTSFRTLVAHTAYGTDTILPMNQLEAADVAKVFEQRGADREMHQIERPPFPPPLATNGVDVDPENLALLDDALWKLRQYNHPRSGFGRTAYNFPITFGADGGLVVGTGDHSSLVCFTSTVDPNKEQELFDRYADPNEMYLEERLVMGAGDSSASIVALFNSVDPQLFIGPHLEGREKDNAALIQHANTIFVSSMSRIVGSFLTRTRKTHWANIGIEKLEILFADVAQEALKSARAMVRQSTSNFASSTLEPWGITTVTWKLGRVAYPDSEV